MSFFWHGVREAWHLIVTGDPYLRHVIWVTVKVATVSTGVALAIGLPLGLGLGLGRFRGRGAALVVANTGLMLPPVVVGLVLSLLMFPAAPLGRFQWLFTLRGVYIAQVVLALPVVVALTASSVRALPAGLFAQARALGAGRVQLGALALSEARIGVLTATIAAIGSALSEVGAVVLVGGNVEGYDQTLASAALQQVNAGHYADGVAIAIVLLGLMLVVTAALTVVQRRGGRPIVWRAPS
jgi:tungstate transport system permease protein